jgi:NADPH:quinone reductase-like Zn-dependent oxidoreductase
MRAIRFSTFGPPSVLSLQDIAKPVPQPGEALVEVAASAINPSDVKFVSGLFNPTLPRTPGRDYAGTVVTASPRWIGKTVWGNGRLPHRSRRLPCRVCRDAGKWLSEMPANLSMDQAAAVGVPYVAAWSALVVAGGIRAGETVLITGASGAVGRAATRSRIGRKPALLAPTSTTVRTRAQTSSSTPGRRTYPHGGGAYRQQRCESCTRRVGGPVFEPAMKSMGLDGRQIVITSVGSRRVELDLVDFYHSRQRLIGVDTAKLTGDEIARILDELRPGCESGALKPSAVKTWPLDDAVKAYEAVAAGDASAKHILNPKRAPR